MSITRHFAKFISAKVKSGRYGNASEVVREALRRFEQDEQYRHRRRPAIAELLRCCRRSWQKACSGLQTGNQEVSRYRITRDAPEDLDTIWDHIAREGSRETAASFLGKFYETFQSIASSPAAGVAVRDLKPEDTRKFPMGKRGSRAARQASSEARVWSEAMKAYWPRVGYGEADPAGTYRGGSPP